MIRSRVLLLAAACLCGLPSPAGAQTWAGWNVYWENDSFVPSRYGSDARYTNGIRYTLSRDPEEAWEWSEHLPVLLSDLGIIGERSYVTTTAFVLGQNFFTPSLITSFDEDPTDRPFAGFLYAGVRADITQEPPDGDGWTVRKQHSFELDVGVLGPPALAEAVQKGVHLIRRGRIPKGWDHQLSTEPAIQALYTSRVSLRYGMLDLVPHAGIALGSVQTYGRVGGAVRIGTVQSFPSLLNPWTVARTDYEDRWFEWAVLAAVEGRGYLRNAYVDGNLFGDDLAITPDHTIGEWRLGAMTRFGSWSVNYSFVHRDSEFVPPPELGDGSHNFGSVTIGRDLVRTTLSAEQAAWLKKDWLFEASLGRGVSWRRTQPGNGPRQGGVAMRFALSKGLTEHVLLGGELAAVLREGGPPDADGWHEDTFYVTRAITLGWRPLGRSRQLVLRGGVGRAIAKVERTRAYDSEVPRNDTGRGVLLGVSYGIPVGQRGSIGVDATWSDLSVGSSLGLPAAFLAWGIGFKWHP